ncbi:protein ANTAGONIST OF LIKE HETEROCHROMATIN PROTEIN 1-like [Arachis stenosperma]|uniref:protein ANTAGONIST OF LIKE HETEROCHROMATIN PROTEIN 1-like n=1 Tax=Arachis stenosperma TaxID=217475 RepID=UPI0025ABB024|nr:protein ANTAGONIST OF LIKE HETEROCHROMATIN PROTEIN 1-like [Arachis stenosperma]
MNILAACIFDLKFTYVLPGWEGSASNSRILENAIHNEDNLNIPQGKFYLADAGYMLRSGLIISYRSTRYHLSEYSRHPPENPKELFNLRHFSLRNAIERAFGVLKNRFPILSEMSRYNIDKVSEIIISCCILHNFLIDFDPDEEIIAQVDRDLMNNVPEDRASRKNIARGEDGRRGEILRDTIAAKMWNDYIHRQH